MTTARFAPGQASPRAGPTAPDLAGPDVRHGPPARDRRRRSDAGAACVLIACDAAAALTAVAVTSIGLVPGCCYVALPVVAAAAAGLYRPRIGGRVSDQVGRLASVAGLPALALLPWTPAGAVVRLAATTIVLSIALRAVTAASMRAARRRGLLMRQTLIVGAGQDGRQVYRLLREHPELGLWPCGVVDGAEAIGAAAPAGAARRRAAAERQARAGGGALPFLGRRPAGADAPPFLGCLDIAGAVLTRFEVAQVLVCAPVVPATELASVLRQCRRRKIAVSILPGLPELGLAVPRTCLDEVWGIPFVPLRPGLDTAGRRAATRALDLVVGLALLLVSAPLMLVLALAVWLDLRLPPLFRQVRVVGRGRLAAIVKLRTLRPAGDPDTSWAITARQSTRLGRLLRRTHADELPQLASVVHGDMSLVGPRPERPYFASQLRRCLAGYAGRERVRSGLTGWAQVHGLTGDTSIEDRARFDNFYIEYWSIWLDLLILARTALAALSGALTKGGTR